MLLSVLLLILGFVALVGGADLTVRAAVAGARRLGISPLVVGLTVVAFGTSVPELAVAVAGVLHGSSDLVMGNVVGSNVANIGLILGVSALVAPVAVNPVVLKREGPFLVGVTLLWFVLSWDLRFGRGDALVYLAVLALGLWLYVKAARREIEAAAQDPDLSPPERAQTWSGFRIAGVLLLGLVTLSVGGEVLVRAVLAIARALHVSERVIALTVVALGTSLPELATSLVAAIKGHGDMSIGNVVGSNIMNLLAILGVSGSLAPLSVDPRFVYLDMPLSLVLAVLVLAFAQRRRVGRLSGLVLLTSYLAYVLFVGLGG